MSMTLRVRLVGDAYADHSTNCYWLGAPLDLHLEIMRPKL